MANIKVNIQDLIAKQSDITPYEVFRLLQHATSQVDPARAAALKPQMMYNYDRNGLIVSGRKAKDTGEAGRYTHSEVVAFVAKWTKKNLKSEQNLDSDRTPENLIAQYRVQIGR